MKLLEEEDFNEIRSYEDLDSDKREKRNKSVVT